MFKNILATVAALALSHIAFAQSTPPTPNVVVIFCDDMGYGDIHPFGSVNPTPNLDRMAEEGMRFTDFYVGQPICSASRATLMTGCYPNRVGILGALSPTSKMGISDREYLMPQMFKSRHYATGMVGKWHLGSAPQFMPTRHGFDEFFGLPYSHDMWPGHRAIWPDLPLYDGEKVVQRNPDPSTLTTMYTEHAVSFIDRHKNEPFFLYVAHNLPHVPLGVSEKNKGKGGHGLYSDVVYEIDWSVGQIFDALKRDKLDDNTLVIFTSDNGPWLIYGNHAGSAGELREGKMTTFDGGLREPCIMRWPGKIPAGTTCHQIAATMDLLPTFATLIGAEMPHDRVIDGKDIRPLMMNQPGATTPHDAYYYYHRRNLDAVRSGKWKLHFAHDYVHITVPGKDGKPGTSVVQKIEPSLFDLETDISEQHDVSKEHPDVVARLKQLAETAREDLGDDAQKRVGKNVREVGMVK